jgi:hypothetical protein
MGPMNCNNIDTGLNGSTSRLSVRLDCVEDFFLGHLARCSVVLIPGGLRRALNIFAVPPKLIRDEFKTQPGRADTALAAGVL